MLQSLVRCSGTLLIVCVGSLAALVYQHSITPLALPCKLMLPTTAGNTTLSLAFMKYCFLQHIKQVLYVVRRAFWHILNYYEAHVNCNLKGEWVSEWVEFSAVFNAVLSFQWWSVHSAAWLIMNSAIQLVNLNNYTYKTQHATLVLSPFTAHDQELGLFFSFQGAHMKDSP